MQRFPPPVLPLFVLPYYSVHVRPLLGSPTLRLVIGAMLGTEVSVLLRIALESMARNTIFGLLLNLYRRFTFLLAIRYKFGEDHEQMAYHFRKRRRRVRGRVATR